MSHYVLNNKWNFILFSGDITSEKRGYQMTLSKECNVFFFYCPPKMPHYFLNNIMWLLLSKQPNWLSHLYSDMTFWTKKCILLPPTTVTLLSKQLNEFFLQLQKMWHYFQNNKMDISVSKNNGHYDQKLLNSCFFIIFTNLDKNFQTKLFSYLQKL